MADDTKTWKLADYAASRGVTSDTIVRWEKLGILPDGVRVVRVPGRRPQVEVTARPVGGVAERDGGSP